MRGGAQYWHGTPVFYPRQSRERVIAENGFNRARAAVEKTSTMRLFRSHKVTTPGVLRHKAERDFRAPV